jgi:hypothetical protein
MRYFVMVLILGFAIIPAYAGQPQAQSGSSDQKQQQMGNELGNPVPGSVSDQESTTKKRNPSKAQSADQSSQVTVGGAKSVVMGEVLKVDGDYYFIKDGDSGDEVRLLVNNDTRMICGQEQGGGSATIGKRRETKDSGASEQQAAQGQRQDETASGAGVQMGSEGECQFKTGDKVKAEVSDVGTVTTLRYVTDTKGSSGQPLLR